MNQFATTPGKIVAMSVSEDALFVVYEQPRRWWQFWRSEYAVQRFEGHEI